ncbi:MAG: hypothetical protein KAU14_09660 [Thermoplasmata archaeon]|nr:hypothetical protein [Thermoplasmata archaeon]
MKQHILNAFPKILKITDDDPRNKAIETRADTLALSGFKSLIRHPLSEVWLAMKPAEHSNKKRGDKREAKEEA